MSDAEAAADQAAGTGEPWEAALRERGAAYAVSLGFFLGDYVGGEAEVELEGVQATQGDAAPGFLAETTVTITHRLALAGEADPRFGVAWFLSNDLAATMREEAGGSEQLQEKLPQLADELADLLATDKYTIHESSGEVADEPWAVYRAQDHSSQYGWAHFHLQLPAERSPSSVWLGWPVPVLERMFELTPMTPPTPEEPAAADTPAPPTPAEPAPEPDTSRPSPAPSPAVSSKAGRLLKIRVPVSVTLANKDLAMSKLLDLGTGSIIEFDRSCDEPLELMINNIRIGYGEAVKVGDHFGLKITQIASPHDRVLRLGRQ